MPCCSRISLSFFDSEFLLRAQVVAGLLDVHVAHRADRLLGVAHDVGIELDELVGELHRLFTKLRLGNGDVRKPDLERTLAVEGVAGDRVVHRVPREHHVGQVPAHDAAGDDAPVHFGEAESRFFRRYHEVHRAELRERAAEGVAVDHRDGRLRELRQPLPAPAVARVAGLGALLGVVLLAAEVKPQVLARAPGFAFAAEDQHLGLFVRREPFERIVHVVMELGAHGVALLRTVEHQEGDAAFAVDADVVIFLVGHWAFSFFG